MQNQSAENQSSLSLKLIGEESMVAFGKSLGLACQQQRVVIFLEGDLGMGKTTLSRGVLQAFGHQGAVKSPTYTLVEPYEFAASSVYHFDLYRLGDPEELEYMGIRDYFEQENSVCLIEWPDKGAMFLPVADLVVRISAIQGGRELTITSQTETGAFVLKRLNKER